MPKRASFVQEGSILVKPNLYAFSAHQIAKPAIAMLFVYHAHLDIQIPKNLIRVSLHRSVCLARIIAKLALGLLISALHASTAMNCSLGSVSPKVIL